VTPASSLPQADASTTPRPPYPTPLSPRTIRHLPEVCDVIGRCCDARHTFHCLASLSCITGMTPSLLRIFSLRRHSTLARHRLPTPHFSLLSECSSQNTTACHNARARERERGEKARARERESKRESDR
jgi:hypothetical protein